MKDQEFRDLITMSLERVLRLLESFGFSKVDSEVYIYLAKAGPQGGRDIARGLKMTRQQLYSALRNLRRKGVISSSLERPALFSALAFEELLDLFVKLNIEQAQIIKETRDELLANWRNATKRNNT